MVLDSRVSKCEPTKDKLTAQEKSSRPTAPSLFLMGPYLLDDINSAVWESLELYWVVIKAVSCKASNTNNSMYSKNLKYLPSPASNLIYQNLFLCVNHSHKTWNNFTHLFIQQAFWYMIYPSLSSMQYKKWDVVFWHTGIMWFKSKKILWDVGETPGNTSFIAVVFRRKWKGIPNISCMRSQQGNSYTYFFKKKRKKRKIKSTEGVKLFWPGDLFWQKVASLDSSWDALFVLTWSLDSPPLPPVPICLKIVKRQSSKSGSLQTAGFTLQYSRVRGWILKVSNSIFKAEHLMVDYH